MTDLVYDYITMGVDMMISAAILMAVIILLRGSVMLSMYSAQQQTTTDRLNYYKEFAMYDCTDKLLSPDALSAMVYYKYDLDIIIQVGSNLYINDRATGKYYVTNTSGGARTEITYAQLASAIGTTKKFKAYLSEDYTGTISSGGYTGGIISGLKFVSY